MQIRLRTPDHVRAQKLALNAQDVAVAAADVQHCFDAGFLLNQLAGDLGTEAGAGARTIGNVDAVDSGFLGQLRSGDFLGCVQAARRKNFDKGNERPGGQLCAQLALVRHRDFLHRLGLGGGFIADYDATEAEAREGCRLRTSLRISLMCSGVVPQQPPTIRAPAFMKRAAYCAMYSPEHR